ncbi:unnamed protein product [Mesocestoides corti]|uniref:Uncharacterized protein n=1 Tax=Mesocestoides corti TaxID=53468 RepID=A0A0R3U4G1_MESCO|nr:unnamed protein product [Mesocestoides corti]
MLNHGASHLTTWRQDIILALPIKTAEAAREFAPATTTTTAAAAAATQRSARPSGVLIKAPPRQTACENGTWPSHVRLE